MHQALHPPDLLSGLLSASQTHRHQSPLHQQAHPDPNQEIQLRLIVAFCFVITADVGIPLHHSRKLGCAVLGQQLQCFNRNMPLISPVITGVLTVITITDSQTNTSGIQISCERAKKEIYVMHPRALFLTSLFSSSVPPSSCLLLWQHGLPCG